MPQVTPLVVAGLVLAVLAACTTEQIYDSGRAWQRSQCAKVIDRREYERCLRDADLAYDEYKKRKEADQRPAVERKPE